MNQFNVSARDSRITLSADWFSLTLVQSGTTSHKPWPELGSLIRERFWITIIFNWDSFELWQFWIWTVYQFKTVSIQNYFNSKQGKFKAVWYKNCLSSRPSEFITVRIRNCPNSNLSQFKMTFFKAVPVQSWSTGSGAWIPVSKVKKKEINCREYIFDLAGSLF